MTGARREAQRRALRARRKAIEPDMRAALDNAIAAQLDRLLEGHAAGAIAVYWPINGEPDLRRWYERLRKSGRVLALPAVVAREKPLEFRVWRAHEELARDALGISCPPGPAALEPELIVAPCVAFDKSCFRLGAGGGYYDRTLAALGGRPMTVGVAYEWQRLDSIAPEAHDVPLDVIVTEEAVYRKPNTA